MNNYWFIGIVQNGLFRTLATEHDIAGSFRLTRISIESPRQPESDALTLNAYEGSAIMVRGIDKGEWIYSAEIIDQAGPLLTAVVLKVFSPAGYKLKLPMG